jgi:hypothetical protein
MKTLRQWVVYGIAEILLSLVLLSVAPIFLNSSQPILGFLIWLVVVGMLSSSVVYVVFNLTHAYQARRLFLRKFPEYSYLSLKYFLGLSTSDIAQTMEVFEAAKEDPDFQSLQISPLDLLRHSKKQ